MNLGAFLPASAAHMLLLASLVTCDGCERRPAGGELERTAPARRYLVRAEVVALPDPKSRDRELGLRHEPIDGFVDAQGRVVGMDSMVMLLAIERPLSLEGIALGTKVEVLLSVDFARGTYRVERLVKLPDSTVLTFGKARPSGDGGGPPR